MSTKPEISVAAALLDAAEDHLHQVDVARITLARSATRIVAELKTWETALRTIDANQDHARDAIGELRALRPSIRGRRHDLGRAA